MKHERLHPVSRELLRKIDGIFYVNESDVGGVVSSESFVPVYFTSVSKTEVIPDSPVMGAESYGGSTRRIFGPFSSQEESDNKIEKERENTDSISYDFSGKTKTLLVPEEDFKGIENLKLYEYFYQRYVLAPDTDMWSYRGPSPEQFQEFFAVMSSRLKDVSPEITEEDKDDKRMATSKLSNSLIELSFSLRSGYVASYFGNAPNGISQFISSSVDFEKRHNLGFDFNSEYYLREETDNYELASLKPVKQLTSLGTIDDILKSPKLI